MIDIPIPQKNEPTSFDKADPPDEQALTFPPRAALNLFKTNLSAILYFKPKIKAVQNLLNYSLSNLSKLIINFNYCKMKVYPMD